MFWKNLRVVWGLAFLVTHGACASYAADAKDPVVVAMKELLGTMKTAKAQGEVIAAWAALRVADDFEHAGKAKEGAIRYLCDIKAKRVLLAILRSDTQQSSVKMEAVSYSMGLFQPSDIPELYEIAIMLNAIARRNTWATGPEEGSMLQITRRLCHMCGVKYKSVPNIQTNVSKKDITRAWLRYLQQAKTEAADARWSNVALRHAGRVPVIAKSAQVRQSVRWAEHAIHGAETAVEREAPRLRTAAREALAYVRDVRAKATLLRILSTHRQGWVRKYVAEKCLGVFTASDIPELYDAAMAAAVRGWSFADASPRMDGGLESDIVCGVTRRACELLGVKYEGWGNDVPPPRRPRYVRESWIEYLVRARQKGAPECPFEAAIKYIRKRASQKSQKNP